MKKPFLILAVSAIIIFLAGTYFIKESDTYKIQKEIADSIIRFHVRANSDSEEDQELKLLVKNKIVQFLEAELKDADSLDEARNILYDVKDEIAELARGVIREEGYEYNVEVYFERAYFPMKVYGDMSFPPGEYEAFRVDIGDACGKNWGCVLYPPLCFVDSTYSVVPKDTKEQFEAVLSEKAYQAVTMDDLSENTYECRFRFLTFLNRTQEESNE